MFMDARPLETLILFEGEVDWYALIFLLLSLRVGL